jgi:hypothetical protein
MCSLANFVTRVPWVNQLSANRLAGANGAGQPCRLAWLGRPCSSCVAQPADVLFRDFTFPSSQVPIFCSPLSNSHRRGPKKAPTFLPPIVFPMASPSVGLFFQEASSHLRSSASLLISTHLTLLHRLRLSPFFVLVVTLSVKSAAPLLRRICGSTLYITSAAYNNYGTGSLVHS